MQVDARQNICARFLAALQSSCRGMALLLAYLYLLLLQGSFSVGKARSAAPAASSLQIQMPVWSINRSSDLILNFTTADAAARQQESAPITFRGKPLQSVSLRKGYFYGNLAVVRFGSQYITAVRKIQFYLTPRTSVADYPLEKDPKKKWISWWTNKISLCTSDPLTLQPQSCTDFEPRNWTDCLWNGGFETLGPEDPRLIIWPSKGLFMMFNSKPWPVNPAGTTPDDTRCAGPWAQQPWLVPLATFTGNSLAAFTNSLQPQQQAPSNTITTSSSSSSTASSQQQQQQQQDPWTQALIRLQYLPPELQQNPQEALQQIQKQQGLTGPLLHKEKNWNPFIYKNELYFSQSFVPHIVIKPTPDGTCRMVHMTDGLTFSQLPSKPRGNTQAVLLPAAVSGLNKAVYLGIVHTEVDRSYANYLYQMEAEPPFAITAVSAPLPMVPSRHPRVPAWDHISFPMSLQLLEDSNQLMIGYGSGDQVPRVRFMPLEEALALFETSSGSGGSSNQQQATVVAAGAAEASAATEPGLAAKLASKLAGYSPRAQAAAQEAVAAVEAAMGLQPTAAPAPTG